MARSLIRQLEQIRRAATYDDAVAGVNTSAVAEPTVSGSLEEDTNVIRTLMRQLKFGTTSGTNWYDDLGNYFDPTDTDAGNTENKELSLNNIKNNTLDAKTIILAVSDDNSGNGYTVSGTDTGVLLSPVTTNYADPSDRTGLPIYASTTNSGSYYDEGGMDRVCRIDIVNTATDTEFVDTSGNVVYGKFHDGADFSGTGENTDVYVRFYADDAAIDWSTVSGVSNIKFVYPVRKVLSNMAEYEWLRTDFVSSWEGDYELMEDISNLWSYTGATDGDSSPQPWSNTSSYYLLQSDPTSLQSAIDAINTGIGNRTFSESNYISDGDGITTALDALDVALQDVSDSVSAGVGEKYVEAAASDISANVEHPLPYSITYTPESTAGREGKNMDVFVDGQLLAADTGANGANADRDYGETTTSGITFRFNVQTGRNITYVVRQ
jgi:hypothetical protein